MEKRSQVFYGKISAWVIIMMTLISIYSFGYAMENFKSSISNLGDSFNLDRGLYSTMLFGIGVIIVLDLILSFTLYKYFKEDDKKVSGIAGILRLAYTVVFGCASYFLAKTLWLNQISGSSLEQNIIDFEFIWNIGLIVFGAHILLLGYLMKLNHNIPKALAFVTIIAGLAYILVHSLKFTSVDLGVQEMIEGILILPMILGELGLAIWLLTKGAKV